MIMMIGALVHLVCWGVGGVGVDGFSWMHSWQDIFFGVDPSWRFCGCGEEFLSG